MDPESIGEKYEFRKEQMGSDFERMRLIKEVMEGEVILPLPELTSAEKPAVANLAQQGMNQISRRIASVEPTYYFPPMDPSSDESVDRAQSRDRIMTGWRHDNMMKQLLGKRARMFLAYAAAPVVIKPDPRHRIPKWYVRDALYSFPSDDTFENYVPGDCIFSLQFTWRGLKQQYGGDPLVREQMNYIRKPSGWDYENDVANDQCKFTVLEYIDEEEIHMVLLGFQDPMGYEQTGPSAVTLLQAPNLAKRPLAVIPGSINLDKQLGHFDGIIGMYQTQAALMALNIVAQRRAVWPREWAIANPGEQVDVVSIPDPYSGTPGEIQGGKLDQQTLDPNYSALDTMDRLAEAQRQTASLPAEFGGQSATNIRTGRRGAQVMGASIDFTIAEAQDIFATSLVEEDKIAIAIDKTFFPRKKTYFIATRSFAGKVEYTPSKVWETDAHVVDYPIAGTDLQNLPIEGGQRVAMHTLSRRGFMNVDPVITDVDAEIQQIHREGVEDAFLTSIQTLASAPEGPYQPVDLARLDELLAQGEPLYKAVNILQKEVQARQAQVAADQAAQQPGLSPPGQGVEQPAAIPEGTASMQNLTGLLGQLGTAQTARAYRPQG